MVKSDKVSVSLIYHHRTDKAVLVSESGVRGDGVWLPLSQVECDEDLDDGDEVTLEVPEWLAERNGFM